MQLVVLSQDLHKLEQSEICTKKDTPRLLRQEMTLGLMTIMCETLVPAEEYFAMLSTKYAAVIKQVPSAHKLRKRLVMDGEDALQNSFRCCLERHKGNVELMNFDNSDSQNEFAYVQRKLEEGLETLRQATPAQKTRLSLPKVSRR